MVRVLQSEKKKRVVFKVQPSFYFKKGAKFASDGDYKKAVDFFHRSNFHEDGAKVILQDFQVEQAYDLLRRKFEHKVVVSKLEKLIEVVHKGQPDTISSLKGDLKDIVRKKVGPIPLRLVISKVAAND